MLFISWTRRSPSWGSFLETVVTFFFIFSFSFQTRPRGPFNLHSTDRSRKIRFTERCDAIANSIPPPSPECIHSKEAHY